MPRNFSSADTGVSQSSTSRILTGTTFASRASSRAVARSGSSPARSETTAIEDLHDVDLIDAAGEQQHAQVIEQIGRLLCHPLL